MPTSSSEYSASNFNHLAEEPQPRWLWLYPTVFLHFACLFIRAISQANLRLIGRALVLGFCVLMLEGRALSQSNIVRTAPSSTAKPPTQVPASSDLNAVKTIQENVNKLLAERIDKGEARNISAGGNKINFLVIILIVLMLVGAFLMWWVIGRNLKATEEELESKFKKEITGLTTKFSSLQNSLINLESQIRNKVPSAVFSPIGQKASSTASINVAAQSSGVPANIFSDVKFNYLKELIDKLEVKVDELRERMRGGGLKSSDLTRPANLGQVGSNVGGALGDCREESTAKFPGGIHSPGNVMPEKLAEYQPSVRQKIGLCFVDFCSRERGDYVAEEFEPELRKQVADVKVQLGYWRSSAQEPYFSSERPQVSCYKAWVVTVGSDFFLLPWAMSANSFDTVISCFEVVSAAMPKNLKDCLPATLKVDGKGWSIEEQGRLSTQPDETLQQWCQADQKARQLKTELVVNLPRDVSGETTARSQKSSLPNEKSIGRVFVQFCKWLQQDFDNREGTVNNFMTQLRQEFKGAILKGQEAKNGDVYVWRVILVDGDLAKIGWQLPAIKSSNEFYPLSHEYFTIEGDPPPQPETVEYVEAQVLEATPGMRGELQPKSLGKGKVSTTKLGSSTVSTSLLMTASQEESIGGVPATSERTLWEDKLIEAAGAAFIRSCSTLNQQRELRREFSSPRALFIDYLKNLKVSEQLHSDPVFHKMDIVETNGMPTLQRCDPDSSGDVWVIIFKSRRDNMEVSLVIPRFDVNGVLINRINDFFDLGGAEKMSVNNWVEAKFMKNLMPCRVRLAESSIGSNQFYQIVTKGSLSTDDNLVSLQRSAEHS